jgi:hypothetical protein
MVAAFNDDLKSRGGGELKMASNRVDVSWQGLLPVVVPFLQPAKETNDAEFLAGGLFPFTPNAKPPPVELVQRVSGRTDLVYYDWEITQYRLLQWRSISQVLPIFAKQPVVYTNELGRQTRFVPARVPEQKWLTAIEPMLGNTITEVTYKSPNELHLVRKSHLGLTSVELVLLSHWLASPNFPFSSKPAPISYESFDRKPPGPRPQRP